MSILLERSNFGYWAKELTTIMFAPSSALSRLNSQYDSITPLLRSTMSLLGAACCQILVEPRRAKKYDRRYFHDSSRIVPVPDRLASKIAAIDACSAVVGSGTVKFARALTLVSKSCLNR